MRNLAGLILGALTFGLASTAVAQNAPVIGESPRFRVYCEAGPVCDDLDAPAFSEARAHGEEIVRTLESVQDWFTEMRYPVTQLRSEGARTLASYGLPDACGFERDAANPQIKIPIPAAACVRRLGTPRMIFPREQLLKGNSDAGSTAHEYSHSLHVLNPVADLAWLDEAMARAIGQEWNARNGTPFNVAAMEFELALDVPFNTPPQEGNAQGDYFQYIGDHTPGPHRLGYLRDFFRLVNDGYGGMTYLYRAELGSGSFDFAYPEYVARFNSLDKMPEGDGRFYSSPEAAKIDAGAPDQIADFDIKHAVQAFAAGAIHLAAISVNEPTSGEDRDALMVVELSLKDAARIDDLKLIHEHRKITGHSLRFLVRAEKDMDLGFIRVTNAAMTAETTEAQGYTLNLHLTPVEFLLPQCVQTGGTASIEVDGGVIEDVRNFTIVASAGKMDGLSFTAPANAQKVSFSLRIKSQITRPDSGIRPKPRPDRVLDLGQVTVARSCMIQMGHRGGLKATYDALNDYTEYDTGKGTKMYLRPGVIAMYDARKGGWQDVPPMMHGLFSGMMPPGVSVPGGFTGLGDGPPSEPDFMARWPRIMTERFSWAHVSAIVKRERPNAPVSQPVACPAGTDASRCRIIARNTGGRGIDVIYDEGRRVVGINFNGEMMVFRYGTFEIARPPGW